MKLRCERDTLVKALSSASRAGARTRNPIFGGLYFDLQGDHLAITGTDGEITIIHEITVNGEIDGKALIPSKILVEAIRALPGGTVEIELGETDAVIHSGRSQMNIRALSESDFPNIGRVEGREVTLEAQLFAAALKRVVIAASVDLHRPSLVGVLIASHDNGIRLVATDSYRLSMFDLRGVSFLNENESVIVPARALEELLRNIGDAEDLKLVIGDNEVSFITEGATISTRLIDVSFPDYERLLPEKLENQVTVSREQMIDSVNRVRVLARNSTRMSLKTFEDRIELATNTQDLGGANEVVDAIYVGEPRLTGYDSKYLVEGLEVAVGDEVVFSLGGVDMPAILTSPSDEGFLYLLMPMRV